MGKTKFELSKIVDECRLKNNCNVFHLCINCKEKLEHTGKYDIKKENSLEHYPSMECDLCDDSSHKGFGYVISSRPKPVLYWISSRQ